MMLTAARVNEARSRLNAVLRAYKQAEFWVAIEAAVGDDPRNWPRDVVEALLLAATQWRSDVGRIEPVARTYACVKDDAGKLHCALQITYAEVRQEIDRPAVVPPAGGIEAGGSEQVKAAAPARSFSPSMCGVAGVGGWGRH